MSDRVTIDLKEAAEEWANPSGITVNGNLYAVTVQMEKDE